LDRLTLKSDWQQQVDIVTVTINAVNNCSIVK
jgi:hypothetical protein